MSKDIIIINDAEDAQEVSLEVIKNAYIGEGLSAKKIAKRFCIDLVRVEVLIENHQLAELRNTHIQNAVKTIQSEQMLQAERIMDIDLNFKKMRILQLEQKLQDYMAYFDLHGDFYIRNEITGKVVTTRSGIPIQLDIPNVTKEIREIKEGITLSEGLNKLLVNVEEIINPDENTATDPEDVIDMDSIDGLFTSK